MLRAYKAKKFMTTVAFDGKILAVDSRISCGTTITTDKGVKLFKLKKSKKYQAVAFCGEARSFKPIVDWLESNMSGKYPGIEGEAMAITHEGYAHSYYEELPYYDNYPETNVTAGSGSLLAMGAINCGAGAVQAVEAAIKSDLFSGGKVNSLKIKVNKNEK